MQQSTKTSVTSVFAQEIALNTNAKSVIHIKVSTFNLFSNLQNLEIHEINKTQDIPKDNRHYRK